MKTEKIETLNEFDTNNALSGSMSSLFKWDSPAIDNSIGRKQETPPPRPVEEFLPFDDLWDSCAPAAQYRPRQFKPVFETLETAETAESAAEEKVENPSEFPDYASVINNIGESAVENENTAFVLEDTQREDTRNTQSELNRYFCELNREAGEEARTPYSIQPEAERETVEINSEPAGIEAEIPQLKIPTESVKASPENSRKTDSHAAWKICLVSGLTALFIGLFLFGREMLPAYLVKYQVQQATGMSLQMSNVRQDYRAGVTNIESINAYDPAQRLYLQTGHASFSNLPYFSGDNQRLNWAVIENIRFVESPGVPCSAPEARESGDSNSFCNLIKKASREMTDAQLDLVVNNTVKELVQAYEKPLSQFEQSAQQISCQVKEIQDIQLNQSDSRQKTASAEDLCRQMDGITAGIKERREKFNGEKETLLGNLSHSAEIKTPDIPDFTEGSVSECLFLQHGQEFVGQFLYDLRQICRWLPEDLEAAMGAPNGLDPSTFSFRRISAKEQLAVGQIRLTGETRFMNQTAPFSAVITNYSTAPEDKPLTVDIAFGSNGTSRLRIEAQRNKGETLLKVNYYCASNNLAAQFGNDKTITLNSEGIADENVFARTDTIQLTISQGKAQGEYAFVQKANAISVRLAGVSSSENAQKLQSVIGATDKISMNAVFAGGFNAPRYRISSNMDYIGKPALQIAANEYFIRMDAYRNALHKKYETAFSEAESRFDARQEQLAANLNGNVLLLNQLTGSELQLASDSAKQTNDISEKEDSLSLPVLESLSEETENPTEGVIAQTEELAFPVDSTVPLTAPAAPAIANQAAEQEAPPLVPPTVSEPILPDLTESPAADNTIPADEFPEPLLEETPSLTPEQAESLEFPTLQEEEMTLPQYPQSTQSANAEPEKQNPIPESEADMELPPVPEF